MTFFSFCFELHSGRLCDHCVLLKKKTHHEEEEARRRRPYKLIYVLPLSPACLIQLACYYDLNFETPWDRFYFLLQHFLDEFQIPSIISFFGPNLEPGTKNNCHYNLQLSHVFCTKAMRIEWLDALSWHDLLSWPIKNRVNNFRNSMITLTREEKSTKSGKFFQHLLSVTKFFRRKLY